MEQTSEAASTMEQRRVSFQEETEVQTIMTDEDGGGPTEERLGIGHVRMSSLQVEEWARQSLSEASAPRTTDAQAAQEAAWLDVNQEGRANWSVREAVRLHGMRFKESVCDFKTARVLAHAAALAPQSSLLSQMPTSTLAHVAEACSGLGPVVDWVAQWPGRPVRDGMTVRVCVRKRPLLSFEHERSEWDCVEADSKRLSILCHDGRLARNGKRLTIVHRRYLLDQVWDETADNEFVSKDAVVPMLRWTRSGKNATVLCYGQTGTGKTHTLGGCLDMLADELEQKGEDAEAQFIELRGQTLHDLFKDHAKVQLLADASGKFHLRGATRVSLGASHGGAIAMREVVGAALEQRASEATERNPVSSRSHAILVLWLKGGGMLRFVDLAGSERNAETEMMSAAQHRQSAEINASLMSLKHCFIAHAALQQGEKVRMPYRGSRLTQCLRDCFEDPLHRFTLIATVSPASSDVIHTANTLFHVVMMAKSLEAARSEVTVNLAIHTGEVSTRDVPIYEWTVEEVSKWMSTVERGRFAQLVLPPGTDGAALIALSAQGLASMFDRQLRTGRGVGEGVSWNVTGNEEGQGSGVVLGKALFAAARREALAATARSNKSVSNSETTAGNTMAGLAGA